MKVEIWGGPYDGKEIDVNDGALDLRVATPLPLTAVSMHEGHPADRLDDWALTISIRRGATGKHFALWHERH